MRDLPESSNNTNNLFRCWDKTSSIFRRLNIYEKRSVICINAQVSSLWKSLLENGNELLSLEEKMMFWSSVGVIIIFFFGTTGDRYGIDIMFYICFGFVIFVWTFYILLIFFYFASGFIILSYLEIYLLYLLYWGKILRQYWIHQKYFKLNII